MTSKPHKQHEAPAPDEPTEEELKAAIDEIDRLVGDRECFSRQVQDVIKQLQAKSH